MNLILATLFVFICSHNPVIAQTECDGLKDEMALGMVVGFGNMYFEGYNHGKGTDIKYSKSKMRSYINASCAADNKIEIAKIFANAADTNFSRFSTNGYSEKVTPVTP